MVQNNLFPEIEPYNVGMLEVSDIHTLYYEESGNPSGVPIVFLHGGPGSGTNSTYRRFFDPEHYRIVLFDQRGAGRSTPHAELEENTTWNLVEDMEKIRNNLGIDDWIIFGGSWGSTLAFAYSTTHPERTMGRILRGIFLCRTEEIAWYYEEGHPEASGANMIFPEEWGLYKAQIPGVQPGDMVEAYHELLTGHDEERKLSAALAWSRWEAATSKFVPDGSLTDKFADPHLALAFARIENHYFRNGIFVPSDDFLLNEIAKTRSIPTRIVQGRLDMVCPMKTAWEVSRALGLDSADFRVVERAGHSALEKGILSELVQATEDFKYL